MVFLKGSGTSNLNGVLYENHLAKHKHYISTNYFVFYLLLVNLLTPFNGLMIFFPLFICSALKSAQNLLPLIWLPRSSLLWLQMHLFSLSLPSDPLSWHSKWYVLSLHLYDHHFHNQPRQLAASTPDKNSMPGSHLTGRRDQAVLGTL